MSLALVKFLPATTNVPFIRFRMVALVVSVLLTIGSLTALGAMGIKFGIDFAGGIQMTIQVEEGATAEVADVRAVADGLGLGGARVQESTGNGLQQYLVALPLQAGEGLEGETAQREARDALQAALLEAFPGITIQSADVIGGAVSGELVFKGAVAIAVALLLMLLYIWFRFEWQYSVGAIVALTHDVIATIGLFAITQMEFSLSTVAAILTIVGYSMNDTVVVYDRIRENLRKYKRMELSEVLNRSINDTLSRTILTSLTTLVALIALYAIGAGDLKNFAFAMIWGVLIGTYSSVFVAAPLLMFTKVQRMSDDN